MRRRHYSKYSFENFIWSIASLSFAYIFFTVFFKNLASTNPTFSRVSMPSISPWFWVFITIFAEVVIVYYIIKEYRLRKAGIREIDKMSGEQFEEKLCVLFKQLGYSVDHFSKEHRGNEYGIDIIIEKEGIKTAVQAKRFGLKQHVDNTAVEKLVAAKALMNCDQALVVTNSRYTNNARYVSEKLNVELWDRRELINKLIEASSKGQTISDF